MIMTLRYELAQRVAISLIGALFCTAALVNIATSVIPVA